MKQALIDFFKLTNPVGLIENAFTSNASIEEKILDKLVYEIYNSVDDIEFSKDDYRLLVDGEGISGGKAELIFGTSSKNILLEAYSASWSIVLLGADRVSTQLAELMKELRCLSKDKIHVNSYLTPPHSLGAAPHADEHDVLILQLHGTKQWFIQSPNNSISVSISKGNTLFLPKGLVHSTSTSNSPSAHLTLGFGAKNSPSKLCQNLIQRDKIRISDIPTLQQIDFMRHNKNSYKLRVDFNGFECIKRVNTYLKSNQLQESSSLYKFLAENSVINIQQEIENGSVFDEQTKEKLSLLLIKSGCATILTI